MIARGRHFPSPPLILAVVLSAITAGASYAAEPGSSAVAAIDELRAPGSPALELMGVAPSAIARPEAPLAVAASIVSAVVEADGFPDDYALEIAPYWLASRPALTFAQYLEPSRLQTLARTLSLSIASSRRDAVDAVDGEETTTLGLGARVLLAAGQVNPAVATFRTQLAAHQAALLAIIDEEETLTAEIEALAQRRSGERARADAASDVLEVMRADRRIADIEREIAARSARLSTLDARSSAVKEQARAAALRLQELDARRAGFMLAVAAAATWDFPGDVFAERRMTRRAAWITPSYGLHRCQGEAEERTCRPRIDIIGVARWLEERKLGDFEARWDVGARLLWHAGTDVGLSMEYLKRSQADHRLVGVVELRIGEAAFVYGSFGRGFREEASRRDLVSTVGVTIGFGARPLLDLSS